MSIFPSKPSEELCSGMEDEMRPDGHPQEVACRQRATQPTINQLHDTHQPRNNDLPGVGTPTQRVVCLEVGSSSSRGLPRRPRRPAISLICFFRLCSIATASTMSQLMRRFLSVVPLDCAVFRSCFSVVLPSVLSDLCFIAKSSPRSHL